MNLAASDPQSGYARVTLNGKPVEMCSFADEERGFVVVASMPEADAVLITEKRLQNTETLYLGSLKFNPHYGIALYGDVKIVQEEA